MESIKRCFINMQKRITNINQAIATLAMALTQTQTVASPTGKRTQFGAGRKTKEEKPNPPTTRRVASAGSDGVTVAIDVQRRIANALASADRRVAAAKAALETLCSQREENADDLGGRSKVLASNRKDWEAFGVRKDAIIRNALGSA